LCPVKIGDCFSEVERLQREADRSPPPAFEIKDAGNSTSGRGVQAEGYLCHFLLSDIIVGNYRDL
jgi:hypothetical protein